MRNLEIPRRFVFADAGAVVHRRSGPGASPAKEMAASAIPPNRFRFISPPVKSVTLGAFFLKSERVSEAYNLCKLHMQTNEPKADAVRQAMEGILASPGLARNER